MHPLPSILARPQDRSRGHAQNEKVFAEHTKYGRIEVDQDYLNFYAKTPQTVANGAAKRAVERTAAKGVAKMAAEKQVKAKQAAAAKCRAAETTARRLLVEAAKAARVSKMEKKAAAAAEAKAARAKAEAEEKVEENAATAPFESVARRSVSKHVVSRC